MELQSSLPDILGYEELDLVGELIEHRHQIIQPPKSGHDVQSSSGFTSNASALANFNLLSSSQQKDRLKRADIAHKTKELGPKLIQPETHYPHVYKSHDAGNTLSFTGKKYSLPFGSVSEDFEVCCSHTF